MSEIPAAGDVVAIVTDTGVTPAIELAPRLRELGHLPVLVSGKLTADAAARVAPHVGAMLEVPDPYDAVALEHACRQLAGGIPAAVLSWYDGTVVPAALAAGRLGVDRAPARGLALARNKYAMRRRLAQAGLTGPAFALIADAAQAGDIAAAVGLPAIIKPVNGTGSSLVRRVDSVAELAEAYRQLAARAPYLLDGLFTHPVDDPDGDRPVDPGREFLVEGCLTGREYSAETIVRAGRAEHVVLMEDFLADDRFFELGFAWPPPELSAGRQEEFRQVFDRALSALELDNTSANVALIDDERRGPTIVEINAGRPGGQMMGVLARVAAGVDLTAEYLALALGLSTPQRAGARMPPPLATLTIPGTGSGRLVAMHGLDQVREHPDVLSVLPLVGPGELISDDYETHPLTVLVAGLSTRAELIAVHQEIAALVRFEFADTPC